MAVTSVKEDFQVRQGEQKVTPGSSLSKSTTYQRRFVVQTSDQNDGPAIVMAAAGIPRPFDTYTSGNDSDSTAQCISIRPIPRSQEPMLWDVVCNYSTQLPSGGGGNNGGKTPPDRPTKYGMSFTTITRIIVQDYSNPPRAILNSAKQQFHPPLEQEIYLPVVTAQKYEDQLLVGKARAYNGTVNSEEFSINGLILPPEVALFRMRQAPYFELGQSYWDTTYEFTLNWDGWDASPLDQGTLQNKNSKLQTITDQFGLPVNQPVNLDGNGNKLDPTKDPVFFNGPNSQGIGTPGHPAPFVVHRRMKFDNY